MNSINKVISIEKQIEKLKDIKKLNFSSDRSLSIFKTYLEQYGYQLIINEYWMPEFYKEDGITFVNEICSDDIRYIFDIDRTLSTIIWKYFKGIELNFNASITNVLNNAFEKNIKFTYLSLLDDNAAEKIFSNYFINNKDNLKKLNSYTIQKVLLLPISRNKEQINRIIERNNKHENRNIINKINEKMKIYHNNCIIKKYSLVHISAISSLWSFSQLLWIYKNLNEDLQNEIEKNFFKFMENDNVEIKKEDFLILFEIFSDIRNKLAHNVKIYDYNMNIKSESLAKNISNFLNMDIEVNKKYNISIIIKLIQKLIDISDEKIEKEIERNIDYKFKNSTNKDNDFAKQIIKKYTGFNL